MYVAHNRDWCIDMHHVALRHEKLLGLLTDLLDHRLGQELPLEERVDACVQVQYHSLLFVQRGFGLWWGLFGWGGQVFLVNRNAEVWRCY